MDGPHEPESTTPAVTVAAVPGNVPTHNAAFGRIEMTGSCRGPGFVPSNTGRAAVVAAGSGVSAVSAADGTVTDRSAMFPVPTLVADLPLNTEPTWTTRLGAGPEALAAAATVAPFRPPRHGHGDL
ncbi:hypothetical protein [Rhodococcus aetherivorans]|uniref:hypothetical protein n=1 Tax=Rhodococcus aetherivorans TaxID=191292 RepID=UPI001269665D